MSQHTASPAPFRAERAQLLDDDRLRGASLAEALSAQADGWFRSVAGTLSTGFPPGWALLATAGYADGSLCPGSDLDVMLVHAKRADADEVAAVARDLWYPFWDSGLKLSPAVHTVDSALKLAASDLVTATTLLRTRRLAGEAAVADELHVRARADWRSHARSRLRDLAASVEERHAKHGEVAFLLEPNLKDGRGGLRDVQSIQWALLTELPAVNEMLVRSLDELVMFNDVLLDARVELHRATKRSSDALRLQEQDRVAANLGYLDADALMAAVAETARSVAWASDRFWERIDADVLRAKRRVAKPVEVAPHIVLADDHVRYDDAASVVDGGTIIALAGAAARVGVLPDPVSLQRMDAESSAPPTPWSQQLRDDFVGLLDSGPMLVQVIEALDQYGLFARVVPQWHDVRSRPQRNAYHTYTVDRHLLVTVVNASQLVRKVRRPDLLLLGAFLHDIGKNGTGEHVEVGIAIVHRIGAFMGLPAHDIATLVKLVDHHLLLAETATRRDVSDPGTADVVAEAVGDVDTLELLHALTEADSLATGPSAWSNWKAGLIDALCTATTRRLAGHQPAPLPNTLVDSHADVLQRARATPGVHLQPGEHSCVVATSDRRGLFAVLTGVLAAHGIEIIAADAWTTEDGIALDEFRITRRTGGTPDWRKVENDLDAALTGLLDIEARIERRAKSYKVQVPQQAVLPLGIPRAAVLIDNDTSADATILEVRAPDAPALLFRLANVVASLSLDIRHAKVATLGHEVVDVFYVQDRQGRAARKLDGLQCRELHDAVDVVLTGRSPDELVAPLR